MTISNSDVYKLILDPKVIKGTVEYLESDDLLVDEIKKSMKEKGLFQTDLAYICGVSAKKMDDILNGKEPLEDDIRLLILNYLAG